MKLLAEVVAALFGPPLATYTGVLVADTAVPVWHEARHELPWIFGASAAATAGAAACDLPRRRDDAGPARRLAVAGVAAEGALMQAMERRLGEVGEVYHQGAAGKLSRAAKGARGHRRRAARDARRAAARAAVLGGALVCAGEICLRWSPSSRRASSRRATRSTRSSRSASARAATGTKATTKPEPEPLAPSSGVASVAARVRAGASSGTSSEVANAVR